MTSDISPLSSPFSPLVVCEEVVKIYKVADLEVVALQGLDLVVEQGEMLALVGPSGSGKSTLLNILGGLARPSAGKVTVDGQDLFKLSARELNRYRREEVGFVWQQPSRNLVPYLSAEQNVMLPMTLAGLDPPERVKRTADLIDAVGLAERRAHRLAALSGGEQQRVAIAVALANRPRLLLADEPTGEVDSGAARKILATLRRLNRELGLTVVIVTHDNHIASQVDRVVTIRDGKVSTEERREKKKGVSPLSSEELVVLDTAGRLQVPRDYLARFGIRDRARLDVVEGGILIRPVTLRTPLASEDQGWDIQVTELYTDEDVPPTRRESTPLRLLRRHLPLHRGKSQQ
ncbi:MAG: ABC transporter ATP-binding protein [Chloroflexota bacterium]|nr:ABC transporter ATP-binding protein [Chloroflexota bacterium]